MRLVGAAIVGQDPLDGGPVGVEPLNSPHQYGGRGEGGFVVVDLGVGDAGMVVDDGVDVGLAHQRVVVLVVGLAWGGGSVLPSLSSADVAPASAVGDVAELLHVDVEHGAGVVVFVAADGFTGGTVDVVEPVEVAGREDAVDGGGGDPESWCELHWPFAESHAQADAALDDLRVGLVRAVVWS